VVQHRKEYFHSLDFGISFISMRFQCERTNPAVTEMAASRTRYASWQHRAPLRTRDFARKGAGTSNRRPSSLRSASRDSPRSHGQPWPCINRPKRTLVSARVNHRSGIRQPHCAGRRRHGAGFCCRVRHSRQPQSTAFENAAGCLTECTRHIDHFTKDNRLFWFQLFHGRRTPQFQNGSLKARASPIQSGRTNRGVAQWKGRAGWGLAVEKPTANLGRPTGCGGSLTVRCL
jgi:hypothetical protein